MHTYRNDPQVFVDQQAYYIFLVNRKGTKRNGYMPLGRRVGFVFAEDLSNVTIIRTIAHELGHGAFGLRHTFSSEDQRAAEGTTDNLMDYNAGTKLLKYQWDQIHAPPKTNSWWEGDEEGASKPLFSSKYVRLHDELSINAWASTKGKDSLTQEVAAIADSKLEVLDQNDRKTYILFNYAWFDAGNIGTFEDKMARLSNGAKEKLSKELGVADFNLLVIVNAKYDAALAEGVKTVSFREWFFPMDGLDPGCTEKLRSYLNSSARKLFINGLNEALTERTEKLVEYLKGCKVEKPKEIVIHYKRKGRNQYRTWGEFTIVGTEYKGYILERDKGPNPSTRETCKRHPSGTYELAYSDSKNGSAKFDGFVMLLKDHTAYKLHGGNRADQSLGCLLVNKYSPKLDSYPNAFQSITEDTCEPQGEPGADNPTKCSVANSWFDHNDPNNPAYQLRKYIESLETQIKAKSKVDQVIKKIIIDESDEIVDP